MGCKGVAVLPTRPRPRKGVRCRDSGGGGAWRKWDWQRWAAGGLGHGAADADSQRMGSGSWREDCTLAGQYVRGHGFARVLLGLAQGAWGGALAAREKWV